MLYIIAESGITYTWHVGEKATHPASRVTLCQADGDELTYVISHFTDIPHATPKRVQTWKAPWAQFIVDNL